MTVTLADGNSMACDVFDAQVQWDGNWMGINVQSAETIPLIGLKLLAGYEVRIEVAASGAVELTPLNQL